MSNAGTKPEAPPPQAAPISQPATEATMARIAAALERLAALAESQKQPLRKG
jgi:hypothetical protein